MGVHNTMIDLNDHLFAELERLGDEELTGEDLEREINRAKAISEVGRCAIENANVVLRACDFEERKLSADLATPRMLLGDRGTDGRS